MVRTRHTVASHGNADPALDTRERLLLRVLIERFIRDGEPVGSKSLVSESGLCVSSATVRNTLARLEERGYLSSPHHSAGRVPTARGYRFFVDHLLHPTLPTAEINQLWRQVDRSLSAPEMVESTSRLLADLTGMAGVVTLPRLNHVNLRRIEFLPLSDRRVLVILVLHEREVQQRVIRVERDYSAMTLQQAANYLNLHFAGGSLQHIRDQLLLTMAQDRAAMDQLMETVLEVASKTFAEPEEASADCLVLGEANLLSSEHLVTLDRARELFETLRHKQEILHLLDRSLHTEGVRLLIGAESGLHSLQGCSVVTAPYCHQGRQVGVLGLIGPLRMAYQQVIPMVSAAAQLLSTSLNR
ncbi:MAG: heat-inducible transcription repressor HrcA [Pseudomonadales bacterium]|jgi:heat-inducible transcriptional repressor|nr:heat-inducible transcription repressor HrcA [Pseudomonadales bacterium]HMU91047.1 heat-inducible transcriptional repressor HrcA [Pseudomonadales bacterium]HMW15896.1 heat-inducible transcriptional repressor HrcA [Pseudomonadales bacterium]HMY97701.1 heat-inducible transcriptional repressor HrcA [Pseudomonadales bacterium]HMZ71741.1 heat-inducible transcriptional repressor HrcA [Pseudomonadales bacterium]